jgi:hypothetical protein
LRTLPVVTVEITGFDARAFLTLAVMSAVSGRMIVKESCAPS